LGRSQRVGFVRGLGGLEFFGAGFALEGVGIRMEVLRV
jgi:hypothetical protein